MAVTTVLGPVEPGELGRVDAHEHIFLRSPILVGDEMQDRARMIEEVAAVHASGIDTVVDLTPIGLGRRPGWTAEVSRRTGAHVVLATGIHRAAHYPNGHWVHEIDTDTLASLMIEDIRLGVDEHDWQGPKPLRSQVRAGIIKLGAGYHAISAAERGWIEAGVRAASSTGVPVAVHCEVGTAAHEVLDLLERCGLPPARVMLAHMDRNLDPVLHSEVASRGAFLGYDTIGRTKYHADAAVIELIARLTERGWQRHILLGTDVGRKSMLRAYGGGPGMDVLGRTFLPRLRRELGDELEELVAVRNPARFLAGGNPAG